MKKLLIATTLLATSTTALAMSPVQEAKTKDALNAIKSIYVVAEACGLKQRYTFLEKGMKRAYQIAGAREELERSIVDLYYTMADDDGMFSRSDVQAIQKFPEHEQIKLLCSKVSEDIITMFD